MIILILVFIPILVAVVAWIAGKVVTSRAFRRINRLNMGWDKLYKKLLRDGWVPPPQTKWFTEYVDTYHPKCNPGRCWVVVVEEE